MITISMNATTQTKIKCFMICFKLVNSVERAGIESVKRSFFVLHGNRKGVPE